MELWFITDKINIMRINKYFEMREFLPKETWGEIKDKPDLAKQFYKLVSPKLVEAVTQAREYFGKPVTINDWYRKGHFNYRGYRPSNCKVGAKNSMHKKKPCCAIDFNVEGLTSDEVNDMIKKDEEIFYMMGFRRMESKLYTTTWTHLDTKETFEENTIYIFNP